MAPSPRPIPDRMEFAASLLDFGGESPWNEDNDTLESFWPDDVDLGGDGPCCGAGGCGGCDDDAAAGAGTGAGKGAGEALQALQALAGDDILGAAGDSAASAATSAQSPFEKGATVVLRGLSTERFNGLHATVVSGLNKRGRHNVRLEESGERVSVLPANMRYTVAAAAAAAPSSSVSSSAAAPPPPPSVSAAATAAAAAETDPAISAQLEELERKKQGLVARKQAYEAQRLGEQCFSCPPAP